MFYANYNSEQIQSYFKTYQYIESTIEVNYSNRPVLNATQLFGTKNPLRVLLLPISS